MKNPNINYRKPVDMTCNKYCGPTVVAAILGCDTRTVANLIRSQSISRKGRGRITGTTTEELQAALEYAGYLMQKLPLRTRPIPQCMNPKRWPGGWYAPQDSGPPAPVTNIKWIGPTLREYIASLDNDAVSGTYIVNVTGHWVLISNGMFIDTQTHGRWVLWKNAPHPKSRVKGVYRISKLEDGL